MSADPDYYARLASLERRFANAGQEEERTIIVLSVLFGVAGDIHRIADALEDLVKVSNVLR